jgi:hypothetical protein
MCAPQTTTPHGAPAVKVAASSIEKQHCSIEMTHLYDHRLHLLVAHIITGHVHVIVVVFVGHCGLFAKVVCVLNDRVRLNDGRNQTITSMIIKRWCFTH